MLSRRQFTLGAGAMAFTGLATSFMGKTATAEIQLASAEGYGPLIPDPSKLLDLPAGFSYKIISQLGDKMSDGFPVPNRADGMGCFQLDSERVVLIRNHELDPKHLKNSDSMFKNFKSDKAFDSFADGVALPGGTSNIIYNLKTGQTEKEFLSLIGTIRNCAGGITPWGSWLTCEESVATPESGIGKSHGYIFEVSANTNGLIDPLPLTAMGRFNHEAAAVDPKTGIVYLTEDRSDSLFYRFIPNEYGKLAKGGKLQALVLTQQKQFDSRNWSSVNMSVNQWFNTQWIDLSNPESPEDDLRQRGFADGAAVFARGEGIHWADNELYFCCTSGGAAKYGQIMRYQPSVYEGKAEETDKPGRIQLFLESTDKSLYNFGDNLTVTPQGHLLVCEDQYGSDINNYMRGVSPKGKVYPFAHLKLRTETAGACFSADGNTMFVNIYSPAKTLAITGPWQTVKG